MLVRLAETGPGEPVRFDVAAPHLWRAMKPNNRPPKIKRRQSIQPAKMHNYSCALRLSHTSLRQFLALRTSVSWTSVTIITPGAGCSSTSTATVSTTGATGRFTFRAAFFTGAGLGLALATVGFVAFAALATLRALPRLAEFPLTALLAFVLLMPSCV